jgi:hypothetical protein
MANPLTADQNELTEEQPQEPQETSSGQEAVPQNDAESRLVLTLIDNPQELFHLPLARHREAERCLKMLGEFAQRDFEKKQLRAFAQARYVSEKTLTRVRM